MGKKKEEKEVVVVGEEKRGEMRVVGGVKGEGRGKGRGGKGEKGESLVELEGDGEVVEKLLKKLLGEWKEGRGLGL